MIFSGVASSPTELNNNRWIQTLLSYQSLGVVFGHLSIGPLYVYGNVRSVESRDEFYGILSFILWALTLIPLLKYALLVLKADDNGEGGTFALYSLLCRHTKVGLLPNNEENEEEMESLYDNKVATDSESVIAKSKHIRYVMLVLALFGSCVVIANGILVPAISVFSASLSMDGFFGSIALKSSHSHEVKFEHYASVPTACAILICLFVLQHFGTHRIGFLFAPVIVLWLVFIGGVGLYNIFYWDRDVIFALSPVYVYKFFKVVHFRGWKSLSGVLLSIAGSEAMFANLGHFSKKSIQMTFFLLVYPPLVLSYMGHTAFLSKNWTPESESIVMQLGSSMPRGARHIFTLLSLVASIVGSQAAITSTFSIIRQCVALRCFPRVEVVHTSNMIQGQVYIPAVNWLLMALCLSFTLAFKDVAHLGNATGLATVIGMLITSCFMLLIIFIYWESKLLAACFLLVFGCTETFYFFLCVLNLRLSSLVLLLIMELFLVIMLSWHYGMTKKYEIDVDNMVSLEWLTALGPSLGVSRVPGIGFIYSDIVTGIPAFFSHFVTNIPALHQVLIFVSFKPVPVPRVPPRMRYLVGRMGPKHLRAYHCTVRNGYSESIKEIHDFEDEIIRGIAEFILSEDQAPQEDTASSFHVNSVEPAAAEVSPSPSPAICSDSEPNDMIDIEIQQKPQQQQNIPVLPPGASDSPKRKRVHFAVPSGPDGHDQLIGTSSSMATGAAMEVELLLEARECGMSYLMGQSHFFVRRGSGFVKRLVVKLFILMSKNCTENAVIPNIPHVAFVEVGIPYHI